MPICGDFDRILARQATTLNSAIVRVTFCLSRSCPSLWDRWARKSGIFLTTLKTPKRVLILTKICLYKKKHYSQIKFSWKIKMITKIATHSGCVRYIKQYYSLLHSLAQHLAGNGKRIQAKVTKTFWHMWHFWSSFLLIFIKVSMFCKRRLKVTS